MNRREWLLAAAGSTIMRASAETTWNARNTSQRHTFKVAVSARPDGVLANRLVLGQNLQWVDGGDGLLDRNGQPRQVMLERLRALQPTSLRFPGGAQSDAYRWKRAMGALTDRSDNLHFHRKQMQPSIVGTQEFLELCEFVAAVPVITVNTVTGTADEAADWIRLTNKTGLISRITGKRLPSVTYWEIGNEPYLKEGDETQRVAPAEYIKRANAFIRALRAVDPSIKIGVPLRTATIGGLQATPYPDFARDVLVGVNEPYDFISNHNAYMPYLYDRVPDEQSLYWGTMAATATVSTNLDDMAALARSLKPGWKPVQAITEYNAMFTNGKGRTDELIDSQLGALYLADLVRMMADRDDLLCCQYWSLSANWMFGAITEHGEGRANYVALRLLGDVIRGTKLGIRTECASFSAPRVGAVAPATELPLVTSLATREAGVVKVLLINKDLDRPATGRVELTDGTARSAALVTMRVEKVFQIGQPRESTLQRRPADAGPASTGISLELPAASVTVLTLELNTA
ncbi:hypothetical protein WKW79_36005 [Variovorax robiniae]|uniref:Alpha-L-arabinofuranosidase 1 catalytic domain-containing protein n=1 Tax=Variovorax robiniae TaxID=1836199 RepID=A0ABU8XJF5_9BURK